MFEQYKYYKFCMWEVHEASAAENVTWEVSGSHFRFVSETFWVKSVSDRVFCYNENNAS